MIDFRYFIVSIIAIFLALGLGVVVGTTVLDRVTVDALRGQVNGLRGRLDEHRQDIRQLRTERDQATDLVSALAPRVTEGVLAGMQVLFVTGDRDAEWHARVRDAITEAGGENVGSIALTSKWLLEEATDRDELIRAFGDRELADRDPGGEGAAQLGELLVGGADSELLTALVDGGFLRTAPAESAALFPPPTAHVVVLGSAGDEPLGALARGAAGVTPTLVVAGSVEELGPLEALREEGEAPGRLATFDSGDDDQAGVGTVLALRAAADGAGGHFGRGRGLRFLPAPP